jgi:AcrR family transcriptional regulator
LLEAGLEVFGTQGYASASVRAVSAAASLNSRYFYESFTSREDLLYHVYQRVVEEVATSVIAVTSRADSIEEQARTGMRAAWTILTEDRRKARVIALEVVGVSERLERLRRQNRHTFADILVRNAMSVARPDLQLRVDPVLTARSLVGASLELLVDWINGELDATVEQIIDYLTHLFTTATYASVVQPESAQPGSSP